MSSGVSIVCVKTYLDDVHLLDSIEGDVSSPITSACVPCCADTFPDIHFVGFVADTCWNNVAAVLVSPAEQKHIVCAFRK